MSRGRVRAQALRAARRWLRAAGLAGLGLAAPAGAAELVEVRVGVHPGFTRVVFELDAAAGYSIGASEAPEADELVVELEAASRPRRLAPASGLVESVQVEPRESGSLARIVLRGAGTLRLRELVLDDPPRIVMDLHGE